MRWGFAIACAAILSACQADAETYTLYRSSLVDSLGRVHIATFDTTEGEAYNLENCNLVAALLQAQDGVQTRFWCEKGSYRP